MRSVILGGLFSVLAMSGTAYAIPTPINTPTSTVTFSNQYDAGTYAAKNVTDGTGAYWIATNGTTNAFVTIDLGATYNITSLTVQDTHNQTYFDRGTKGFSIGFGNTAVAAQTSASGSPATTGIFSVSDWQNLTNVNVNVTGTGRYVTFLATSAYGNTPGDSTGNGSGGSQYLSVGLTEIAVFGQLPSAAVPEPISMALLGSGLLGLIALRRRSV